MSGTVCLGTGVLPFFLEKDHWWSGSPVQCPVCFAIFKRSKDGYTPEHLDERVNGVPIAPAYGRGIGPTAGGST